eukprot:gnl/TRDRNA2_/TRDRNA2_78781_c1_seq1.p1 gnl/TRDRNA2_/TRDRNA2_78781_c1~~gnl/TRDRNA2_/TRDRNA2_78781_c1_seq1.p1  ORF type:complete len:105 (-),score=5.85 gnl/TRDRNA2_/TRDRNA2_78781_c1_seq1:30-344(-)
MISWFTGNDREAMIQIVCTEISQAALPHYTRHVLQFRLLTEDPEELLKFLQLATMSDSPSLPVVQVAVFGMMSSPLVALHFVHAAFGRHAVSMQTCDILLNSNH